jgi:hypothetical protein
VLNGPRVELRRAFHLAKGADLASSDGEIDREWADAVADDSAGVDELLFQWNKARTLARIAARRGTGR